MKKPLVSIVVPVYGTEHYLEQCVQSLRAQTFRDIEILLVDDESPDRCGILCDGYAAMDPRIRVLHQKNTGQALARQAGLALAQGEYVMFVDSDDWLDHRTVEVCLRQAQQDRSDCVFFGFIREYEQRSVANPLFSASVFLDPAQAAEAIHRRLVGPMGAELRHPERVDRFSTLWTKFYRTETARRGRTVSERVVGTSEDTIFNLYALEGASVSCLPDCLYHYRKDNAQSTTTRHKGDLAEKWDVLYGVFLEYLNADSFPAQYHRAFENRVACGMIGLGLNEIAAPTGLLQRSRRLRQILSKPLYRQAFRQLELCHCPVHWKCFFILCRSRQGFLLELLLLLMQRLRSHGG